MWAQARSAFAQPTNALLSAYIADAGTAGQLADVAFVVPDDDCGLEVGGNLLEAVDERYRGRSSGASARPHSS